MTIPTNLSASLPAKLDIEKLIKKKNDIIFKSIGIDYSTFENKGIGFDYEKMMTSSGFTFEEIKKIQKESMVGNTPLVELKNISKLARKNAPKGKGARIFLKDEAANLSGSFKARRASISVIQAKRLGYKGVIAATSGNYGAAVAAMAAKHNLKCIIVQECFDSKGVGQPEILEKARACEAYGAEVLQLSVGPELFYVFLELLDKTGFFNASLYSPYGIMGIETLGTEIADEIMNTEGKYPEVVIATNAGGGNLTGTARGLKRAGASETKVYGASVDLTGLHMGSDVDFNKKSFTTGHTGFGIPFATNPDRSDVPRSAGRPLRYMDKYYTVNQGSVFYITELLALSEGMERGPAGNTSLAVAFKLAQEMNEDEIIVVQETEYTGAGKHPNSQLSFAQRNGIKLLIGDPSKEIPGKNIVFPKDSNDIFIKELDLNKVKKSYLKRFADQNLTDDDITFLCEELKLNNVSVTNLLEEVKNERKSR